jgi:uncharacterized protein (TIGR02145 family)
MFVHSKQTIFHISTAEVDSVIFNRTSASVPMGSPITVTDTVTITVTDTVTTTVRDTITITVRDTVTITVRDTVTITVRDTVFTVSGVTLNQTIATLAVSDTLTLTATVLPENATNKNVTWSSSDTAVATVLNGFVTAISQGSATITSTTVDGNFTATCEMTIVPIPVAGVTLSHTTFSLQPGFTHSLIATIAPANATNKNIIWTSSNPSVATVNSNGMIVAMSYGWTTITATTQDGNHVAICYLVVGTPVTGVTLNQTTAQIMDLGNTLTLTATVLPANATSRGVTWTSSNPEVATVGSTGVVTAVAWGVATITATTEEGNRTATCVVTVSVPTCNNNVSGWGASLGTVTRGTQEWTIQGTGANAHISQTWSDAVTATACNKTSFEGGSLNNYNSDCRSNPSFPGDLFSWCAVRRFANQLCPAPWRVPTQQDFIDLDRALGGTGDETTNTTLRNSYLNDWSGAYGGYCASGGSLFGQGFWALYWSQESYGDVGFYLDFDTDGRIYPQHWCSKDFGLTLRCVR